MKISFAVLSAVGVLAAASFAQEPNPSVTFTMKAAGVDQVIDALAKQTGVKIAASPAISGEIVMISVTDVPLESLLAQIANVLSGKWTASADGIRYLNYDDSLFRKRSREANDFRAKALTKDLVQKLKDIAEMEEAMKNPPPPPEGGAEGEVGEIIEGEEEMMEGGINFPWMSKDSWVLKVLSRIDPHQLVGIGDARIVFSSTPTRTQLRLPAIDDLIRQMIEEHNKVAFEIEKNVAKNREEDPRTNEQKAREQQMEQLWGGFMQREDQPIRTSPAKVLLVVSRGGMRGMFGASADLTLFDAQGKRIYSTSSSIDLGEEGSSMDEIVEAVMPGQEPEAPKVDTTKPIEFSAETLEMMKVFDMNGMAALFSGGGPKLSEGLMAKLRQPDVFDPLSFGPSDSLAFLASDRKLDVVASLPDAITGMSDLMVSKGLTVGAFVERMQDNRALAIDTKDGWFTVRSFDPESTKLFRVDRGSLAKLIAAGANGPPSMESLAEYALKNESPMKTEVAMPYLTIFTPSVFMDLMMGGRGWSALRLYGTLNLSQRETLKAGGQIPFSNLTPGQRTHVETLLYGVETALAVVDPTKPQDELPEFMKMAGAMFGNSSGTDFRTEPTEVMPTGLPSQGVVFGLLEVKPILTPAEGMMSKMGFDASMVAMFTYAMQEPEAAAQMPQFGAMKLGSRTTLNLRFVVAPNVEQAERLSSDAASSDKGTYALDNLPPVMKAAVDKEIAKLKKLGMFGDGG
ncbi:MAG: hypothetical protein M3R13_01585 [Armatimonadota bacterium]|nr:hypothetical protein [Armatimonadota bacterium]